MREVAELLGGWNGFYVMIGSSAAALTGLMFVVMSLVTGTARGASADGVSTYSTPTVVHFSCALFVAAIMSAPFRSFVPIAIILGLTGAAGMFHVARVAFLTSRLETYRADAEDWFWHVLLPFAAYATLALGALALYAAPARALYAPAAAAIALIFVGIHNAWDVVTYLAMDKEGSPSDKDDSRMDKDHGLDEKSTVAATVATEKVG